MTKHQPEALPCPKIVRGQERLTSEQEEYARQFAQERIASMFSTAAVDESVAEKYLRRAYHVVGLERPCVRWFDSPLALAVASVERSAWDKSTWDSILWGLEDGAEYSVRHEVGMSIWDSIQTNVWKSIDSIGINLGDSLKGGIGEVETNFGFSLWMHCRFWLAYEHECWLAFYRFFSEVFELNDLINLAIFNEMVGGYCLGPDEAWLVRKPTRIEHDAQGRLHSATRPCIEYADGWSFYAWHGVCVPEKVILHPEEISKQDLLQESNLEVRRAIQERLGADRFVELLGGVYLDQGRHGSLIGVDLGDDPEGVAYYVQVQDPSTRRQYYLRVPPTITSADAGVAWTFGLSEQEYRPEQET